MKKLYCNSLTNYKRLQTREVKIGHIPVGGNNPIRIQSMTTTDTMDTMATVEQTIKMVNSGCDYVRITAPNKTAAENLQNIKDELAKRGYDIPLIADIHFTPNAAEVAAQIIEKVRVNPGNYIDKKKFQQIEYTDAEYNAEIERIRERFSPLVKLCKQHGTAMRIGTNHGSLSDRIMSRYGDTPLGMVESALEFARICEDLDYHDIIFSMKASNTRVMVQAYRLLCQKMIESGNVYPIHLGVTEAGDGEDARIKSAVGIGTLLADGIGDTIRVSLTEPPENEAPVAINMAKRYKNYDRHSDIPAIDFDKINYDPYEYQKRKSFEVGEIGGSNNVAVFSDFSKVDDLSIDTFANAGYFYSEKLDKWNSIDTAADIVYLGDTTPNFDIPQNLKAILNFDQWNKMDQKKNFLPLLTKQQFIESKISSNCFVNLRIDDLLDKDFEKLANKKNVIFIFDSGNKNRVAEIRRMFFELDIRNVENPVIIKFDYSELSKEEYQLYSSTDFGAILTDGFGDGLWSETKDMNIFTEAPERVSNRTLFGILQAARVRISKTEYIACPSCGRTLFDLVEVTGKIRKRTEHLKGVKIGIMGCIVNGPGEMADADYGYVGSGPGKITLYREKNVVKKNVPSEDAVDKLIELIKEDGNWIEPN